MKEMTYAQAIEDALAQAMAADERVVIFGEDVPALRMNLYARFGERRVRQTPISESAFLGAAVGAAMAGLRPVAELIMIYLWPLSSMAIKAADRGLLGWRVFVAAGEPAQIRTPIWAGLSWALFRGSSVALSTPACLFERNAAMARSFF